MLDPDGLKVADLLPRRLENVDEAARRELGDALKAGGTERVWSLAGAELEEALYRALDCDVLTLIAEAWAGLDSLREYGDPARHPPTETNVVHFGEHDFVRDVDVVVEATIGGSPCKELRFTLGIGARFDGVGLSVRNGHVVACVTGEGELKAELKFRDVPLHKETSPKLVLPGRVVFDPPGLPILPD